MMMKKTFLILTSLLLLSACNASNPSASDSLVDDVNQEVLLPSDTSSDDSVVDESNEAPASDQASIEGEIVVDSPLMNEVVKSPLHVSGQAVGPWFFEGSFPVRLVNSEGEEIASGVVTSTESWMTEDFIPFTVDLTFSPGTSKAGTLILEKDNPSGLPENAGKLEVPVQF